MKFSATTLLVILPLLAAQVSALAVPEGDFARRAGNAKGGQGGQGSFGGKGGKGAAAGAGAIAGAAAGAAAAGAKGKGGAAANSTSSAAGSAATTAASNATAASGAAANATAAADGGNPQTSLTLDPTVIASGFEQDGNDPPAAGQVASLTSNNNFINFCIDKGDITNGLQIQGGSCNPAPMGQIPPTTQMPSAKFQFPVNMGNIDANTAFTIKMSINGMQTGAFVNAEKNYFAAPQQLNAQQQIIGHSHVVIELLTSLTQTTPLDPTKFAFFQGLNSPAVNGVLTADVSSGLPPGTYKLSSINTAANHQPCLVPIAQHGSLDDAVYFTVGGAGASNATVAAASSTDAAGAASTSAATGGKGGAAAASSAAAAATGAAKGGAGAGGKGGAAATSSAAAAATGAAKGGAGAGGKGAGAGGAGGAQGGANGGKGKQGRRFIREAY